MSVFLFGSTFGLTTTVLISKGGVAAKGFRDSWTEVCHVISTIVCLLFWVSICLTGTVGSAQRRAVMNTLLAITAAASVGYPLSLVCSPTRDFKLSPVMNAMLSAAVAISSISPLMLQGYGSIMAGAIASAFCLLCEYRLQPCLVKKFERIQSSANICYLSGGFVGGIFSAIVASTASPEIGHYGYSLYSMYKARAPLEDSDELKEVKLYSSVSAGMQRSALSQCMYQLAGVATVVAVALAAGILTGLVLRLPLLQPSAAESDHKLTTSMDSLKPKRNFNGLWKLRFLRKFN